MVASSFLNDHLRIFCSNSKVVHHQGCPLIAIMMVVYSTASLVQIIWGIRQPETWEIMDRYIHLHSQSAHKVKVWLLFRIICSKIILCRDICSKLTVVYVDLFSSPSPINNDEQYTWRKDQGLNETRGPQSIRVNRKRRKKWIWFSRIWREHSKRAFYSGHWTRR